MTRNEKLVQHVCYAMGNSDFTLTELLKQIHNSHHDIKNVYCVTGLSDRDIKTISIKCHDRTLITMAFDRTPEL